jgi:renal tumor antigen
LTLLIQLILEYRLISKKGEGTFSEVLKAQSTKSNKYVAIKCMKAHFYNIEQASTFSNQ